MKIKFRGSFPLKSFYKYSKVSLTLLVDGLLNWLYIAWGVKDNAVFFAVFAINFLSMVVAPFAFSTSVFYIMCKSSYGFYFIGSLYKMKKYKRIKKYFSLYFTVKTLINWLKFFSKFLFLFMKREQRIWDRKEVYY